MMNIKLLESKDQGDDLEGTSAKYWWGTVLGFFVVVVCLFLVLCFLLVCLLSIELQNLLMRP